MIHGIINIRKEQGYTSHDVVAKLRGIVRQKKIGHTGTLDPFATGVLPVCLGKGTKVSGMLTDTDKVYEAELQLGVVTDTQDLTGKIMENNIVCCQEAQAMDVIRSFVGKNMQVPPMYSAVKVQGKRLYQLAREGIEIPREAREVHIYEIFDIQTDMELKRIQMKVSCSKGTYIRTLCHDIGKKLGCGGCMSALNRIQAGRFRIEDSITLKEVEEMAANDTLLHHILPVDLVFDAYGTILIKKEVQALVFNGSSFTKEHMGKLEEGSDSKHYKVYSEDGIFVGIYQWSTEKNLYIPTKIFYSSE